MPEKFSPEAEKLMDAIAAELAEQSKNLESNKQVELALNLAVEQAKIADGPAIQGFFRKSRKFKESKGNFEVLKEMQNIMSKYLTTLDKEKVEFNEITEYTQREEYPGIKSYGTGIGSPTSYEKWAAREQRNPHIPTKIFTSEAQNEIKARVLKILESSTSQAG